MRPPDGAPARVLIVGCGALGRELVTLTRGLPGVDVTCLPADLHNRPERIPAAVAGRVRARGGDYDRVFVAYADCGTGGRLDAALAEFEGVERIAGAHCYEFYAGSAAFAELQDEEPGTFYLTDFLARQFERIVWHGLGLDAHPELLPVYFGNYRRLVYLAQTDDEELMARARGAATRLGLTFEWRRTGFGELAIAIRLAVTPDAGASGSVAPPEGVGRTPLGVSADVPVRPAFRPDSAANRSSPDSRGSVMARAALDVPLTPARPRRRVTAPGSSRRGRA